MKTAEDVEGETIEFGDRLGVFGDESSSPFWLLQCPNDLGERPEHDLLEAGADHERMSGGGESLQDADGTNRDLCLERCAATHLGVDPRAHLAPAIGQFLGLLDRHAQRTTSGRGQCCHERHLVDSEV